VSARKLLLSGLWAVAVFAALSGCALLLTNAYGNAVLPFYRWELSSIAPDYEVRKLDVDHSDRQPKFNIKALDTQYVYQGDLLQPPGTVTYTTSVLVMYGLQHVVLVFFVPLAWPGLTWKRRLAAVMYAIPALCAIEFVDIPWCLVGGLEGAKSDMAHTSETFATIWGVLLDTGGRLALGLAGGVLACEMPSIFENSQLRKLRRRKSAKCPPSRKRAKV